MTLSSDQLKTVNTAPRIPHPIETTIMKLYHMSRSRDRLRNFGGTFPPKGPRILIFIASDG